MATPLTDSINALTQYANETTGKQDATLSDAVYTLASGYGGGDSGVKIDSGIAYIEADAINIVITHNLEGAPDFAFIYADLDNNDLLPYDSCYMVSMGKVKISDTPNQRLNSMPFVYLYKHPTSGNYLTGVYNSGQAITNLTTFTFARGSSNWRALDTNDNPIPYKWVVGRFTT